MRQDLFSSSVKTWALAVVAMGAIAGCGSTSTSGDPCGAGEHVRTSGRGYCVYQGGIVIEGGFECPASLPFRIDVGDGAVCAEERQELDELPGEVCTKFERGCTDADPVRDGGMPLDASPTDASMRECDLGPIACTLDCTASCDGATVAPTSCCECPAGTFDRPTMCPALLGEGALCSADTQCASGRCYGDADEMGAFEAPTCRSACLPQDDRAHYCNSDEDCCAGGVCCIGCGELEGLCRPAPPTLGAGEQCGVGIEGVCGDGLSCCYPCGIPGCTNVCEPTCTEGEPGCVGGCFLRP